ncbi:MAG: sulfotransferase, partial [Verrucomicrobiota bacterium]
MKTIFIIGEQRSGSNLLRLILNSLPGVSAPHPPHFLERTLPILDSFGPLEVPKNFAELVDHLCGLVESNPIPWKSAPLNRMEVASRAPAPTLLGAVQSLMTLEAEANGKTDAWVSKSVQDVQWADQIEAHFDRPLYLHLFRDP